MLDGKKVKINTDYRVALKCLKAINDDDLNDIERTIAVVCLLFGTEVDVVDYGEAIKKANIFLCCGKKNLSNENTEIVMDFEQDDEYIRTSIRTDYGINLNEVDYMHWWEYNELIHGLTEKSILNRVINIRQMDETDYKDSKIRSKIRKAKKSVELKNVRKVKLNTDEKELLDKLGVHLREEVE